MLDIGTMRLTSLRKAIQANEASFPSQVPVFVKHAPATLQRHVIQLYFLRNWSCPRIAKRYGATRFYIWQIINEWKRHAVSLGYVQSIPPIEVFVKYPGVEVLPSLPPPQHQDAPIQAVA
jgi:hypothetical protein